MGFSAGVVIFLGMGSLITAHASTVSSYIEINKQVVVEAEDFATQHLADKRRWLVFSNTSVQHPYADSDVAHVKDASGGKYIEILPDTRTNHSETLVRGENFSDQGGQIGVLTYPIYFTHPGRYYIWARAYSTGSEDNGVHFGINGTWPQTSARLQLCTGKHQWTWSSARRVPDNHCGSTNTVYLDVPTAGVHILMVSMREDGFELDKFILTQDQSFKPEGVGPNRSVAK